MKKIVSFLTALTVLVSMFGALPVLGAQDFFLVLSGDDFASSLGAWSIFEKYEGSYTDKCVMSETVGSQNWATKEPVKAKFTAPLDGEYYVYVRTRDFEEKQGTRVFDMEINGTAYPDKFGKHGTNGWDWDAPVKVTLKKGENTIAFYERAAYARFDAVVITDMAGFIPPVTVAEIKKLADGSYVPTAGAVPKPTVSPTGAPIAAPTAAPAAGPTLFTEAIPSYNKGEGTYTYYYITPDDFVLGGGWITQSGLLGSYKNALSSDTAISQGGQGNAYIELDVKEDGEYFIWARTRDFATQQGTRKFGILAGGQDVGLVYGKHGFDGWKWEKHDKAVTLAKGKVKIELFAGGDYARSTGFIVTNNPELEPENEWSKLAEQMKTPAKIVKPEGITVMLDGVKIDFFGDQEPVINDETGRTLVPLRKIFEAMGASIEWNEATSTVTAVRGSNRISLTIGSQTARKNGSSVKIDQPPILMNARTMVPVRFIGEAFGGMVEWREHSKTVAITSSLDSKMVYLRPESFTDLGTWTIDGNVGAFGTSNLRGLMPPEGVDSNPSDAKPAVSYFNAPATGEYKIYARSRDFKNNKPGSRFFQIRVNDVALTKTLGQHNTDGWAWEEVGTLRLEAGKNKLELVDTSGYWPRVDGVWLTLDHTITPPASYDEMTAMVKPYNELESLTEFPEWASAKGAPVSDFEIANGGVKVKFYETPTSGQNIIQAETYINVKGDWVKTNDRNDSFAYLLMYANKAERAGSSGQFPAWRSEFLYEGQSRTVVTGNAFKMGLPYWLIPTSAQRLDENTAVLTATCDVADMKITYVMPGNGSDPKVTWELTAKTQGSFSVGMFGGPEISANDLGFVLNPFRIHAQRLPQEAYLVSEAYSSAALSTVSTKPDVSGQIMTYGIAIDPSSIPKRWAYETNSVFGMGSLGLSKGAQAYAFAPLFGSKESVLESGDSYSFTYRPVVKAENWDVTYSHIITEIFGVNDYRKNYYASLTDASFNMYDLMLDDYYSGWDPVVKAWYNMEGRNVATHSDVLSSIQPYLLTEDAEFLERRTIPTLEFMLTRGTYHFTASTVHDGTGNYLDFKGVPHPLTGPVRQFGTPVYGGAYYMTRGQSPVFAQIGMAETPKSTPAFYVAPFADYVYLYQYTNKKEYLDKAIEIADRYIEEEVYGQKTVIPDDSLFIMLSYYPDWISLLDLYEATKNEKHLKAAEYSARWAMTTLWTQPMPDPKKEITIVAEELIAHAERRKGMPHMFWHGDEKLRLNFEKGREMLSDEIVPEWLPSRVGLGIEQTSTFRGGEQSNIIMSNWAPDFIRLAQYTGDDLFEVYARNAVIGRYANYPGYYINQFEVHNMRENFPYEGPDYSNIYYHHIPLLMTTAQDFLITQSWKWSNEQISFPAVRQLGYVWFINKHYGFDSGDFFDLNDMWLWMKEGLIKPDNVQIDWIGARKDGVFAAALMNQDAVDITSVVTIGNEVADDYSGEVVLYDAAGNKSTLTAENGKITVNVPAKSLVAISINTQKVKKPSFANVDLAISSPSVGDTVAAGTGSDSVTGVVLQIDPSCYFAYVYSTLRYDEATKAVIHYKIGNGEWKQEERIIYPFEFTIKVDDASKEFEFFVEIDTPSGKVKSPNKVLKPLGK